MGIIVSGGKIGYAALGYGRVWGTLFDAFGWKSSFELESATTDHQGDEISVEAIAQSNPDWLFVLDRDAAVSAETAQLASEIIEGSNA